MIIGESNGIVLREEGMAALAPRKLWRARNAAAVPGQMHSSLASVASVFQGLEGWG